MDARLMLLIDLRTQTPQGLQMEVDGAAADAASAQRRYEGLSQTVQERAGEQDRNTGRARKRVHIGDIGQFDMCCVNGDHTVLRLDVDTDAVQAQQIGNDLHIPDLRNVLQCGYTWREQCRDHGLAHEVLRTTHPDRALKRFTPHDMQYISLRFNTGHGRLLFIRMRSLHD